jgi:MoaA/NifB/PqqE/SkfB family radical SAM enzyme
MKCKHCWVEHPGANADIDPKELLDFISGIKPLGLRHISLSGGETTLYPHLCFLTEELIKRKCSVSITTNATSSIKLRDIFQRLDLTDTSKIKVRVSIDGPRTTHDSIRGNGAYRSAIEEASRISNLFGGVGVNTVVMSGPCYLEEIIKDFSSLKITDWALITPVSRGRLKNTHYNSNAIFQNIRLWQSKLKELFPYLKVVIWDYLSHPNGGIIVEADGMIKMPGISEKDDIIIGHIRSVGVALIREHMSRRLNNDPIAYFAFPTF